MKFRTEISKFANKEDMVNFRNKLLDEASALLDEGKDGEYSAKLDDVKLFDAEFEQYAEERANINAMKGAVTMENNIGIVAATTMTNEAEQYRTAFMNYVLKGTEIPAEFKNADAYTTTSDVGAVIPNTIIDRIVEKMENVGGVYAKLTKTFYKGGVTVPTSAAKPVASWVAERGGSDKQKKALGSVTFAYHKLRCVIAVSLAVDNVTLEVFERTVAANIAEAMTKAIENAAFNGTGTNEPVGILQSTVPNGQTIDIIEGENPTYATLLSAEGALPEAYDGAEWYMKKSTFYTKFLSLVDSDGQPIARVNQGLSGKPEAALLGRKVNFVEYVPAFASSVTADTPFAVLYDFKDYILNTNLQVTIKEYEDHDTDDQIKKAVMLADGKPVDLNSLVVVQVKNS